MKFGYACINLSIPQGSPNKRVTFKRFQTLSEDEQIKVLHEKSTLNLQALKNIVEWNAENNVFAYRISSDIFPLTTHEALKGTWWKPTTIFEKELYEIGKIAKESNQYLSLHPGQFTVLTSPNDELIEKSIYELQHHYDILNAMNLNYTPIINIHGGGKYGDVKSAMERFVANWDKVPYEVREMITLENDQHIYNPDEILELSQKTGAPMVFDTAHWSWNKGSISSITQGIEEAFKTWPSSRYKKIHVSSQKDGINKHAHADYILKEDLSEVIEFYEKTSEKFVVMLECKAKNLALLSLREQNIIV